jgi:hypothetical protein
MELSSKKTITIFCPATLPLKTGAGINAFNLATHTTQVNKMSMQRQSLLSNMLKLHNQSLSHLRNKL